MRVNGIKIYNPVFGKRVILQKPDGEKTRVNASPNPKPEPKPQKSKGIDYII